MGKSRLAQVLRERIASEPHTRLFYQCLQFREDVPLDPVVSHIENAARFERNDTPEQKLDKLEAILAGSPAERRRGNGLPTRPRPCPNRARRHPGWHRG